MWTSRRIRRPLAVRSLIALVAGLACLTTLGIPPARATPRALPRTTQTIAAGRAHTCALMRSGIVRCWGFGYFGQLGSESVKSLMDQPGEQPSVVPLGGKAVSVTAAAFHTCALMGTGVVRCWGDGVSGQLGAGSQVNLMSRRGQEPSTVSLGARAVAVSAGIWHTCAILVTGRVRCWGHAKEGALGSGSPLNLMDEPGERASTVPLGQRAIAISAGGFQSCALLAGGIVRCWGLGVSGQLGSGAMTNLMDQPEQLGPTARGRRMDAPGERPARVPLAAKVLSLAPGSDAQHACAVIAGGGVRCWGYDNVGQAGSGSSLEAIGVTAVRLGAPAAGAAVGEAHSCAVLVTGVARCWGGVAQGALGSGSTGNLMNEPGESPSIALRGVRLPTR